MKRLKKFVTLFTLAAVCFAIPGLGKITVKAAEPTTYVLNYSDSSSEWRYKEASSWSAEVQDRELYYLQQTVTILSSTTMWRTMPWPSRFLFVWAT